MQILPQEATKEELEAMERAKKAIKVSDVLAEQAQCEEMMPDAENLHTNRHLVTALNSDNPHPETHYEHDSLNVTLSTKR